MNKHIKIFILFAVIILFGGLFAWYNKLYAITATDRSEKLLIGRNLEDADVHQAINKRVETSAKNLSKYNKVTQFDLVKKELLTLKVDLLQIVAQAKNSEKFTDLHKAVHELEIDNLMNILKTLKQILKLLPGEAAYLIERELPDAFKRIMTAL